MDLCGHGRTHAADPAEVVDARALQPVDGSKVVRQQAGHRPADMADAERNQKPQQRCRLAGLDPVKQVLRRLVRKALQGQQLLLGQVVQVRRILDQFAVDQLLQRRVAKALDVERANEVAKVFEDLGGAQWIDTTGGRLPGLSHQVFATFGASLRHVPGAARRRPLLFHDADDLGDDVAGALDDDVVPRPHIFASYFILVV